MAQQEKLQLRWGICSAGLISFDFADAVHSLPKAEQKLVAVAARDLERAKKFAEQFEIPKTYDDYAAMANDAEVNIVYIGGITNTHYDLCKLYLNAGKHVLCEKALTCAAWQAEDLIALAKQKKLFFMEAMWTRCFPFYPKIHEIIDSGEIGKVQFVELHFCYDAMEVAWAGRLLQEELGAGAMWDQGVYALQFADYVFREKPLSVKAVGTLLENGVDVSISIALQYSNGRFANLIISAVADPEMTAVVQGSKAKLTLEEPFYTPLKLTVKRRNGESRTIVGDPLPKLKYPTKYRNSEGLVYEAKHVYDCVSRGLLESFHVPHCLTLWMQNTIDDVLRQLGRPRLPQRGDAAKQ